MSLKNGLIMSIVLNVLFVVLMFHIKNNAHNQAKDFVQRSVEPMRDELRQVGVVYANNQLLWELLVKVLDSDRTLRTATQLAKEVRLPNREGEKAFLKIEPFNANGQKGRRIGWEKYTIDLIFDDNDRLVSYSIEDIMDRGSPNQATLEEGE